MPAPQSHGRDCLQGLHEVGWLSGHTRPLGFHACPYPCRALIRAMKMLQQEKGIHTKASGVQEASRHPSLGSLVSHTRLISRLWASNICGRNFGFRRPRSYLAKNLVSDFYTSQRYAYNWLAILYTVAPWVVLKSIHGQGEETFPNGDQEPT